jgi:hypothetical protein
MPAQTPRKILTKIRDIVSVENIWIAQAIDESKRPDMRMKRLPYTSEALPKKYEDKKTDALYDATIIPISAFVDPNSFRARFGMNREAAESPALDSIWIVEGFIIGVNSFS